jgi:Ca2+/H+ antiporter
MERLILIYAALVFSTVFVLSYLTTYGIEFYLTAFALEFFLAVVATSPYNRAEGRRQMLVGAILIVIFIAIVVKHALTILK